MGHNKSEIFTEKLNQIAMFIKAFGYPARVAIVKLGSYTFMRIYA